MKKKYDKKIEEHYRKIAQEQGLSSTSTMADEITRDLETNATISFIDESLRMLKAKNVSKPARIVDVGCGNGYTLQVLSQRHPEQFFLGIEKSEELRELALSRFIDKKNVSILEGDIRDKNFARGLTANILICQRVLINLLDIEDQKLALNNIINTVNPPTIWHPGGSLLFIEAFLSTLMNLNEARNEFDLPPIYPAHHNLYLPDNFFETSRLKPFSTAANLPSNLLSTHYYVSRVLHPLFAKDKPFKRNSEFVKFFTHALKENIGDYSPSKFHAFQRVDEA